MKVFNRTALVFVVLALSIPVVKAQSPNVSKDDNPIVIKSAAPTKYPLGNFGGASGNVIVWVKINWAGEVISAIPITGHQILRPMCVKAAKRWMFESIEDKKRDRSVKLTFTFLKAEKTEDSGIFFKPPYTIEFVDVEVR